MTIELHATIEIIPPGTVLLEDGTMLNTEIGLVRPEIRVRPNYAFSKAENTENNKSQSNVVTI